MNNNYPIGAQNDSRAPYNQLDKKTSLEWEEETYTLIQDEAQFYLSNNLTDKLLEGCTIEAIIEEAIEEGLALLDEENQKDFYEWANYDLYNFLEERITLVLTKIRF